VSLFSAKISPPGIQIHNPRRAFPWQLTEDEAAACKLEIAAGIGVIRLHSSKIKYQESYIFVDSLEEIAEDLTSHDNTRPQKFPPRVGSEQFNFPSDYKLAEGDRFNTNEMSKEIIFI